MLYCPSSQGANITITPSNQTIKLSPLVIFTISLHGLVATLGIVENLVILVVVGLRVRRSVISIWILNLAASDLLTTSFLPFFTVFMAKGNNWTLGPTLCRIQSSVFFLNMFVSGFLLAAISMDRCLMVLRPVWAQKNRNIQLVAITCGVIWALAMVCTIPFYMFRDTIILPTGRILCYYNYARFRPSGPHDLQSLCKHRKQGLAIFRLLLAFLIPLIIIIFSYVAVNTALARRSCRRPFRFVRLVMAVVVSFILCWTPYHLFIFIQVMVPSDHPVQSFASKVLPISATIGILNSVLNPILYVFSCPDLCNKIRHSLSSVLESVLVEDLVAEMARRYSTARGSLITTRGSLSPAQGSLSPAHRSLSPAQGSPSTPEFGIKLTQYFVPKAEEESLPEGL